MSEPVEDGRLRLALEESWRSMDLQRDQLGEIKNRAIGMLSVATVAIGLFSVSLDPDPSDLDGWAAAVVASWLALLACALFVAFPRRWVLAREPASLHWYVANGKTIDEMRAGLLEDVIKDYASNGRKLRHLERALTASVVSLGVTTTVLITHFIIEQ